MKGLYSVFILIMMGFLLVSCTIPHASDTSSNYESLEQTAIVHITQTFEAMPSNTPTFTPVPTETPLPTATELPVPTENTDGLMITRNGSDPENESNFSEDLMITRNNINSETNTSEYTEDFLITRIESMQFEPTKTPEPTATVYFPDKADFVSVLPSPNQFVPNQRFYLTWQIKNIGTTTWSGKYRFYYSDGIQLADQSSYSITQTVSPGEILTINLPATAPAAEGTYQTTWTLENPDGIPFYYIYYTTIVGDRTFITQVPELNPTSTPSGLEWMCSDPERSKIQGDGCVAYCSSDTVEWMNSNGLECFANGERVKYEN